MRAAIVLVVCLVCTALVCTVVGCTSASDAQSGPPGTPSALPETPGTSAVPTVLPSPSTIAVSDAVPSLDELRSMGIGDAAAECFIDTIDPDGTGRVANAELFMESFTACL